MPLGATSTAKAGGAATGGTGGTGDAAGGWGDARNAVAQRTGTSGLLSPSISTHSRSGG